MKINPQRSNSGFTLVELLVAITIFAILSVALSLGLKYGAQSWRKTVAVDDQVEEIETAQRFLRTSITAAYPLFSGPAVGQEKISFSGTSDTLSFLTPMPKGLGDGGYAEVTLSAVETAAGRDFLATIVPELGSDDTSPPSRTSLVSKISSLRFSYFGARQDGQKPAWMPSWQSRSRLPQLISIDVEFFGADARIWPRYIVAPVIAADVGCVYTNLTKSCRGR